MLDPFVERFLRAFEHLLEKGIVTTQKEFCEVIGIHSNYISGFDKGRRPKIKLEHLNKLYTKFHVSVLYLFTGRGPIMEADRKPLDDLPPHILNALKTAAHLEELLAIEREKTKLEQQENAVLKKIIHAKDEVIAIYKARQQSGEAQ